MVSVIEIEVYFTYVESLWTFQQGIPKYHHQNCDNLWPCIFDIGRDR